MQRNDRLLALVTHEWVTGANLALLANRGLAPPFARDEVSERAACGLLEELAREGKCETRRCAGEEREFRLGELRALLDRPYARRCSPRWAAPPERVAPPTEHAPPSLADYRLPDRRAE